MQQDREEALTLEILTAIEARSDVTQRHLADRLGVALGLANSYLKRCVRKGLVKITQAPANRYLYYLTPQGFTEKSRLTGQYLSSSFDFYRRAGASMGRALDACHALGARQVLLAGVSELAEIAAIRAHDVALEIVGTYEPLPARTSFVGKPVWTRLDDAPAWDLLLLTAYENCAAVYADLRTRVAAERIVVPDIMSSLLRHACDAVDGAEGAEQPGKSERVPSGRRIEEGAT